MRSLSADVVITTYATAVRDVDALAAVSWRTIVLDEAQAIKNPSSETAQQLRRIPARTRLALTGTPIENGLGDLWAILDFTNPGLVGSRPAFVAQLSGDGESALRALNGILLFRRTKSEPEVAAELPDKIDELDHCTMTAEQIGLYQAVLDELVSDVADHDSVGELKKGAILAAITALKQICNHPAAYRDDGRPLDGRSGKLTRLEEIVEAVFAADERILVFTHFAAWGRRLAEHLSDVTDTPIACYDGSLARGTRDRLVTEFQQGQGRGALVLSLKAGGTGLNLTAANHVVLYDRWWNPAVEDQARDRAWRIGQRQDGHLAPARLPRHRRRTRRGSRRRQAPHRPARPSPLQLDRRSHHRPAAPRPWVTTRRTPHRRRPMSQPRRKRPEQRRTAQAKRPTPGRHLANRRSAARRRTDRRRHEVGALLRSLGDPPMIGGSVTASHYFTAVIERAAAVAAALALSADLLAQPTED